MPKVRASGRPHKRTKRAQIAKKGWEKRRMNNPHEHITDVGMDSPQNITDVGIESQSHAENLPGPSTSKMTECSQWEDISTIDISSSGEELWDAEHYIETNPHWSSKSYRKRGHVGVISSDECERIETHELECEREQKREPCISGNRIVELGYVLGWAISLQYDHSKICTLGKLGLQEEIRRGKGLVSSLVFGCNNCNRKYEFQTEDPKREKSLINVGAVWGTLAVGSTYEHFSEFLSCMDVPTMPINQFYEIESNLGKEWEASLWRSMARAGERERQIALEKEQICEDGTPWITVYVDGSWSKRSYGTNFNALSGMVGIVGKNTGELLFVAVRNKFCSICARSDGKEHICFKNWDGSAPSMESDMAVEGFKTSMEMHGVKYLKFIADGDASVFARIQENVPYGKDVRKIECTNHALKNYGKRLRSIKSDTQISLAGRKLLTLVKINQLTKRAKCSIYEHAKSDSESVDALRNDLRNGLHHVFGDHSRCRPEICNTPGTQEADLVPALKSAAIYNHLNGALDLLVRKAHLLISNENNNRAERLMNIVARFNEGKRLNLVQRGSYQRRVHLSGLRYNSKFDWHSSPFKHFTGHSPGSHFKKYIEKNMHRDEMRSKRRLFEPKFGKNKGTRPTREQNLDYGPNALESEDPSVMVKDVDELLSKLQVDSHERDRIQKESVGQFGNVVFESERRMRLTASQFGNVIKRRPHTRCHNLVKSCLTNSSFFSEATEYGIAKEKVAVGLFEGRTGLKVAESGLWVDLTHGYLGASPDGLIGNDCIIEVKSLYAASKLQAKSMDEVLNLMKSKICLTKINGQVQLKRSHIYYYQVQGQLNVTGRQSCFFVVYVNDAIDLFIEKIERDEVFWRNKMLPTLTLFYKECIAPEIIRNNIGRNLRCRDPPYIEEAIKVFENKKQKKLTSDDTQSNKNK